jgi:hypothetical protein
MCVCLCLVSVARLFGSAQVRPVQASDAETFRAKLLDGFARGDRRAVAGMVRYRLIVDAGGLTVPIVSPASLLQMWDIVFPPEVRCMIEQSAIPRQGQPAPKYAIAVDSTGAFFGDGRVRVDRGADGLKITRLVLPPGYGSGLAGKPQKVLFRWGKGQVTYRGRLSADNVDVYLVQARAGDLLSADLERVHVERASVRVVQQTGNRVLPAAAPTGSDARRTWAGRVPESGEYRVEVVRHAAYCDPPVTYQLKVRLE